MHWIARWDVAAFHAINGLAGTWLLDHIANGVQINLIRGLPFVAPLWYFWAAPDRLQQERRGTIIQVIVAVMIALLINRAMASLLPFRVRPMYDPASGFLPMSITPTLNLESWSSFPSDTATFFFALACGAYLLSRRLGLALLLYAAVVVCLPRAYMGIHYPGDLIVGALLGFAVVKILVRGSTRRFLLCDEILGWARAHPGVFALIAGFISFELIVTFDDVRFLLHGPVAVLRHGGLTLLIALVGLGIIASIAGAAVMLWLWRRQAGRASHSSTGNL